MTSLIYPLFSLIISLITVKLIKDKFSHILQDIPNDRSSHTQPTPRGGGLGIIIAFALTSLIYNYQNPTNITWWWIILTPLVIVGIADDRYSLSAKIRYPIQLLVATAATLTLQPFPQPWLTPLGSLSHPTAIFLTIIGFTAIINFYNFLDGLDGLVASTTAIQLSFLAIYTHQPILWLLVTAILGFLYYNWSPAKIFMGDAGSTFLGAAIALSLLQANLTPTQSWTALSITTPLLLDAIYTITRRLLNQENIFQAHRSHIYQRLQQTGISHSTVAITYSLLTILTALLIFTFQEWGAVVSVITMTALIPISEYHIQSKKTAQT
jgi:Fuc2NAc and GlcNAc transferase